MLFFKIIFHRFDAKNNLSFTHEMIRCDRDHETVMHVFKITEQNNRITEHFFFDCKFLKEISM